MVYAKELVRVYAQCRSRCSRNVSARVDRYRGAIYGYVQFVYKRSRVERSCSNLSVNVSAQSS